MDYWNKRETLKAKALSHTQEMEKFERQILESAMETNIYGFCENSKVTKDRKCKSSTV